jgi:hypothetical protein
MTAVASDLRLSASGAEQKDPESEGFNMLKFCATTNHDPDGRRPFAIDLTGVTTSCDYAKVSMF